MSTHTTLHLGLDPESVKAELRRLLKPEQGLHLYHCGPAPFMDAVQAVAQEMNWDMSSVHLEHFTPPAPSGGDSFQVELAKSGKTFVVSPTQTILEVLAENGVVVETSCQQGVCGTCITKVLSGEPDHRDTFLSDFQKKSGKKIAVCISRCKSEKLVLDL